METMMTILEEETQPLNGLISDDLLVHVKAQVMTSDEEIGGWIPMGMGGLSHVALRKRSFTSNSCEQDSCRHEYLIHGQRLSDKSEVLNCILRRDLLYRKPNPTFHHWKTDEKRFGLTFQTPGDARAFHKGVKRAIDDMLGASPENNSERATNCNGSGNSDEQVFMNLDLPLSRKDSMTNSASTTSTTTSSPAPHSPAYVHEPLSSSHAHHHLYKIDYGPKTSSRKTSPSSDKSLSNKSISSGESRDSKDENVWVRNEKRPSLRSTRDESIENAYYVQFAKPTVNEYSYPALEPLKLTSTRDPRNSLVKQPQQNLMEFTDTTVQTPLPTKVKRTDRSWDKNSRQSKLLISKRSRCVYCNEMFMHDENHKGDCQEAPDRFQECIERVSCIVCARGMLYHCMSDADGDYGHPCVCDTSDENNTRKWTALTVLSLLVPCLWCYGPMMACHHCGVAGGCCGGRHKAAATTGEINNC